MAKQEFFSSLLGEQIGATAYFFATDHLGSIREMIDSSGAVRARYDYDPYGRITKSSGDLEADFGFTGFYRHQSSGLSLTFYRAYDANLGRWLSKDPLLERAGTNLYFYVLNSPLNHTDPLGLWQFSIGGAWGVGLNITFGYNRGEWNVGLTAGIGLGGVIGFNPNDNAAGQVNGSTGAGGINLIVQGGDPDVLEIGGSVSVMSEWNSKGDYWNGITFGGEAGNMYIGGVSGTAAFGNHGNLKAGTMVEDKSFNNNGWGYSAGGLILFGACTVAKSKW